jgi:hypothetical protein
MKRFCYFTLFTAVLLFSLQAFGDVTVLPNGTLNPGDTVLVTGDYVRVRKGPSLKDEIITKVNKKTEASIIERGENVVEIQGMKNYWYKIKLEKSGIEGWMFGHYLNRKQEQKPIALQKAEPVKPEPPKVSLLELTEIGTIEENASLISTGDLDRNGVPEIMLVRKEEKGRYNNLIGYEKKPEGYSEVYRVRLLSSTVDKVTLFDNAGLDSAIIAISGGGYSSLYSYGKQRNALNLIYKLQTPDVAVGTLDGSNTWLLSLRKNNIVDNDGTETFYLGAAKLVPNRGRVQLKEKIEYMKPLPVKKVLAYDLDNDKKDEIICEIGGGSFGVGSSGGGIAVLKLKGDKIIKYLNSGVNTYKDGQFVGMWGVASDKSPKLMLYTTDPSSSNDVNTKFGFLVTSLKGKDLVQEKFYPLGPMLDDINNTREIRFYQQGSSTFPFIVLDYDQDAEKYIIKAPSL